MHGAPNASVTKRSQAPEPTVLQNAHSCPSEWPLTCYFSIPCRVKPAFCPPRVREFRVAQVSAPRPGKPVPLSPVKSRCVPFCRRISIHPLAWLPAGPTALTHAASARLKRPTLEIRFASHPRDSPKEATIRQVQGSGEDVIRAAYMSSWM